MSIDEIDYWNDYFKDKIKNKNQPITHLFNNIKDEFPKSIRHFIIMFIRDIFLVLMMKCYQELIVINLEKEQMKNQL